MKVLLTPYHGGLSCSYARPNSYATAHSSVNWEQLDLEIRLELLKDDGGRDIEDSGGKGEKMWMKKRGDK